MSSAVVSEPSRDDGPDVDVPGGDAAVAAPTPSGVGLGELLAPERGRLVAAVVLQVVASVAGVVPFVAVVELARVLLSPPPVDVARAWLVAAIAAVALLVRLIGLLGAGALTHLADVDLGLALRRRIAARLARVPLAWFTARNSGQVRKAVGDDVSAMHHLVGHALLDMTAAVVVPVVSLGYLFWVDWRLALLTLVPVVGGMAFYAVVMSGSQEKNAELDRSKATLSASAVEFAQGIAVIKTFGQTGRAHRRLARAADDFAEFVQTWASGLFRVAGVMELLLSPLFMLVWILGVGTVFVTAGWSSAVDLLPFVLLGLGLTTPVLGLGYSAGSLRTAREAARRVGAVLATPTLPEPDAVTEPAGPVVELDRVSYRYDRDADLAVDDVSLTLAPGTVTALVGPSGSGKSSLARLLPRFDDPTDGAIRVGGVDLRELGAERLYRTVSFVFQDVSLLRTTVRDNIALARPDADAAEVERVARAAQVHDRVLALPRGYDSVVGEDAHLSGGQAQRVSIARALLADAPVLVLDEATAFADPESEALIQDALSALVAGRTLLVIAHRLTTITGADRIVVLDRGRVVEQGDHDELLALDGRYARAWAAQESPTAARPAPTGGVQ